MVAMDSYDARAFSFAALKLWSSIPEHIKKANVKVVKLN